eukprot:766479-Hanusia_phi.AAC.4
MPFGARLAVPTISVRLEGALNALLASQLVCRGAPAPVAGAAVRHAHHRLVGARWAINAALGAQGIQRGREKCWIGVVRPRGALQAAIPGPRGTLWAVGHPLCHDPARPAVDCARGAVYGIIVCGTGKAVILYGVRLATDSCKIHGAGARPYCDQRLRRAYLARYGCIRQGVAV